MANTIAAIATPLSAGAVSMVRMSGDKAIEIADQVFFPQSGEKLVEKKGYTAAYGLVCDGEMQVDDAVVLVYRAPKSYTGEDVVEITCHGGVYVTREILRLLLKNGAEPADPGEFSKRAFLNGKMNLTQAESIMDLISAHNMQAMKSARAQMGGALSGEIDALKERLLISAGHLAAWADYPEEEIEELETASLLETLSQCMNEAEWLLKTFDTGKMLREGIRTVIAGRANVGKSTLMNLLSGCEKSIVTDIAGTTRDVIEETVQLRSAALRLADTAGIRETSDLVEQKGVELSLQRIRTAELVIAVFDHSQRLTEDDKRLTQTVLESGMPVLAVVNKTDLEKQINEGYLREQYHHIVFTSNKNPNTADMIADEIETLLSLHQIDTSAGMIINERQYHCVLKAKQYLAEAVQALTIGVTLDAVSISLDEAIHALLELTGERVTDKIVDQVFHNFCVGK